MTPVTEWSHMLQSQVIWSENTKKDIKGYKIDNVI